VTAPHSKIHAIQYSEKDLSLLKEISVNNENLPGLYKSEKPLAPVKLTRTLESIENLQIRARNEGYETGWIKGREIGYKQGMMTGRKHGISHGLSVGRDHGKKEGMEIGKLAGLKLGIEQGMALGRAEKITKGKILDKKEGFEEEKAVGEKEGYAEGRAARMIQDHEEGGKNTRNAFVFTERNTISYKKEVVKENVYGPYENIALDKLEQWLEEIKKSNPVIETVGVEQLSVMPPGPDPFQLILE
jgi:flagellar biosynthesis/type III secretory pathway protein FliH